MRTTLVLDDAVMVRVMRQTGETKKARAVGKALEEYLAWKGREAAAAMLGTFHFDLTWKQMKAQERAAMRRKERLWNRIRRGRS
ncbi:MAG: type II toxin-antitoxin system VapB family antitoxin [Planctomycetes bacterium]|nr:type II toxin-antitoxin system VapB family antitoxin [Planctomycetota bacterium]